MRMPFLLGLLTLTSLLAINEAKAQDIDSVARSFNEAFKGGVTLCGKDPKDSVIVEVDDGKGGKKLIRVAQNTWNEFAKDGDQYSSHFSALHRDSKTGEVKPRKMNLKLFTNELNQVQLDLYMDGVNTPAANYDLIINAAGEIEIIQLTSKMVQLKTGKDKVNEGAFISPSRIKVSKVGATTNYIMDGVRYDFTKAEMDLIKKETGKGFFTDNFNEKSGEYEGVPYTISEVRALAEKYKTETTVTDGLHWANCAEVTSEEAALFALNKVQSGKNLKVRNSKAGRTLKNAGRHSVNEKSSKDKKVEKDSAQSAKSKVE